MGVAIYPDQVFGMKWLNELIGKYLSVGADVRERIGGSIQFFFMMC